MSTKLYSYKQHAKLRKLVWMLTDDQAIKLLFDSCHYCGNIVESDMTPGGIDRVDNTHGYVLNNVVSCCSVCNHAKHTMTLNEFQSWIDRLARHQGFTK